MRDINDVVDDIVADITEVELEDVDMPSQGTQIDINTDYNFAREKIVTSIVRSSEVLDAAVIEVKMGANPRNIEAAAAIAKNLNDATENLLKLHKEFRIIEKPNIEAKEDEKSDGIQTSLSDILKAIEEKG